MVDPEAGVALSRKGNEIRARAKGYLKITTRHHVNGLPVDRTNKVHRMVWEVANGPIPKHLEINHINGIKDDNRLVNLELVTSKQNHEHAVRMGLARSGESATKAKLTSNQVREIRRTDGLIDGSEWAAMLGVTTATIRDIRKRKTWKYLTD